MKQSVHHIICTSFISVYKDSIVFQPVGPDFVCVEIISAIRFTLSTKRGFLYSSDKKKKKDTIPFFSANRRCTNASLLMEIGLGFII